MADPAPKVTLTRQTLKNMFIGDATIAAARAAAQAQAITDASNEKIAFVQGTVPYVIDAVTVKARDSSDNCAYCITPGAYVADCAADVIAGIKETLTDVSASYFVVTDFAGGVYTITKLDCDGTVTTLQIKQNADGTQTVLDPAGFVCPTPLVTMTGIYIVWT